MKKTDLLKYYLKKLLPDALVSTIEQFRNRYFISRTPQEIFGDYYKQNYWNGKRSVSGPGSDPEQTRIIIGEIGRLVRQYHVRSILDIPCGDFQWMKDVDLGDAYYIGGDIVPELIERNQIFSSEKRRFKVLNLLESDLPQVDLVIVRDCFIHFSNAHVKQALGRILDSGSVYLLTTTFSDRQRNGDIFTGQWRAINLQLPPFDLPEPLELVNEGCSELEGKFGDKALGLWRVTDCHVR